jgi:hypothetical protein
MSIILLQINCQVFSQDKIEKTKPLMTEEKQAQVHHFFLLEKPLSPSHKFNVFFPEC